MYFETNSEEETKKIAISIAKNAKPNEIYCLSGDLGVGKTVFTKGFAKGLGIDEDITSPTFTIVNEYKTGRLDFFHFDVYRLSSADEIYELGFDEYFECGGVCLIEWAEIIMDELPDNVIKIEIKKDLNKSDNFRIIEVLK